MDLPSIGDLLHHELWTYFYLSMEAVLIAFFD